ncbi:uncharacterized protein LOC131637708 isoform X1 [Vicia villosa]|uniref:uncharacterized protein LOC131637708 isoform X1 n=2 Tax=Vicia villosa TaxID=3911 RepID=UPI00273C1FE2|nr:uncharacterized protein LOC131637708 isoform X1 [Vicia villosa]XP_058764295.1 uncharacterized protein LOC131637708 isoform X1 [Vicia villosa]
MKVNKRKKGVQLGAKKKQSNREQKADVETHVKLNSDEKMSRDDVNISSQLKRPILPSSGQPVLDVPEIIKMFFNGCSSKQGIEQSSTLKQAENQKTTMTTMDSAGRTILKHGQRKQQSLTTGSPIPVGGSAQIQHSTLKKAKNQKTTVTTTDTAERSILQHGKRKQQPFTTGSSIQVAGSAQIQHKKQDHRPEIKKSRDDVFISPQLKRPMLSTRGEPLVDVPDSIKSNAELYRGKLRSFKTTKRSIQCSPKQGMEQSSTLEQAKNQKTMRNTINTAGRSILKQDKRKQQSLTTGSSIPVAGSAQIQHSTLKQAKTQKTMKTTIETAGRSIPNHGQRKQQSFTAGSSIQVEGSTQVQHKKHDRRPVGRSMFGGSTSSSAQLQKDLVDHGSSTKQKTTRKRPSMSLDDYFKRSMQQLEVEGGINCENNDGDVQDDINYESDDGKETNNDPIEEDRSLFGGLSNRFSAQFQKDHIDHGPFKKQKTTRMCPSMSLDDYLKIYKPQLEVEGDINYENNDGDVEGDIDYGNDDGEKTNNNPMEGEASKRGKRGRTRCLEIHARSLAERQKITLNEEGEPIGPTQKIVSEFSNFLGSVARMSDLCPLTYTNWKAIPNKENIWAYVNKKYIVPEKGEKVVYAIVNDAWRRYKYSIKRNHFTKYENLHDRLKSRPNNIPEAHFRKLMNYWSCEVVQKISRQNANITAQQKCRHRAGPISFAIIREKLRAAKDGREAPTQAEVFIETRQSKRGSELDQVTSNTITNLKDLIINSGQSSDEAFQTVFGKEKPGRMRCHGRVTTPSLLKRNKEIAEIEMKHAAEVKHLNEKIQEMRVKHEMLETKHSEEMAAIERKLEILLRVMLINQSNSGHDMGDLVALLSIPNENNNALHSSASAHALNNHPVNHITMREEQSNDDLEEDDEQLYDDLEEDEEQLYDNLEEEDEEQLYDDSEEDEDYTD